MTAKQHLNTIFGVNFEEQQDLTGLRRFHAPNAFCCDEAGAVIGICATKLDAGVLEVPQDSFFARLEYLNLSNNEGLKKLIFQAALPSMGASKDQTMTVARSRRQPATARH